MRNGGNKASGIGVNRVGENFFGGSGFNQVTEMKNADSVGDVFYH